MHSFTLLSCNGIINSAGMNKNHIICQCSERYFNKGNKGADYQAAHIEANDLTGDGDVTQTRCVQMNF